MLTIEYTEGERKVWRAEPRTAQGETPDLTGAFAELRITVSRSQCLPISAASDDQGFAFDLTPEALDLLPGRYRASLWVLWPDGEDHNYADFILHIRKGC